MTAEERKDQQMEQEALRSAKEESKKETSKRIIKKVILNAIKVLMAKLFVMLKVFLMGLIIAVVISSIIGSVLDFFRGDDDEEDGSALQPTVHAAESYIQQSTTKEKVIDFINNYETTNTELKNELLKDERITQLQEFQKNYGYNSEILVAIALEETTVENLDSFLSEMNEKAQNWKNSGYTTIEEIAKDYTGDETSTEWANNLVNKIKEAGGFTSGETKEKGVGYDTSYTSINGKKYLNYKQNKNAASNVAYAKELFETYTDENGVHEETIQVYGCGLTSCAIIISGYTNQDLNPWEIQKAVAKNGRNFIGSNRFYIPTALNHYGIHSKSVKKTNEFEQAIIDNLTDGRPVIIGVNGSLGSKYAKGQHYMAILDIRQKGDKVEVYLSNPSNKDNSQKSGWTDIDTVLKGATGVTLITN